MIRNTTFNFNKLASVLDSHVDTQESWGCMFNYLATGHVVTGNVKIISDSRICKIISKGPNYRLPSYMYIDFNKCREEILLQH